MDKKNVTFLQALINATKAAKIKWVLLPTEYYNRVTNISKEIYRGYYAQYKDNSAIVLYQYKVYNDYTDVETSYINLGLADNKLFYQYEFNEIDFNPKESDLYRLYKLAERQANGIDDFMTNFINEFGGDSDSSNSLTNFVL